MRCLVPAHHTLRGSIHPRPPAMSKRRPVKPLRSASSSGRTASKGKKRKQPDPAQDNPEPSSSSSSPGSLSLGHELAREYYQRPENPRELGLKFLDWLLAPVSAERFLSKYAERRPLYISRSDPNAPDTEHRKDYYRGWFDREQIFRILARQDVRYTQDIDIAQYLHGERRTLNPSPELPENSDSGVSLESQEYFEHPRATVQEINDFLAQGASIRFLCPQRYSVPVWRMLSIFDDIFGTPGGANSYLTPAGTQGFSPHYDDVDVFVLQLEGSKRWRMYQPMDDSQKLAEYSSGNFRQEELIQPPVLDVVLQPGDFLYLPRGVIHQCVAMPDADSLHLTVSTNALNSWAMFLREAVKESLESFVRQSLSVRKALPRNYADFMGVQWKPEEEEEDDEVDEDREKQREAFRKQFTKFWERALSNIPDLDKVADTCVENFLNHRLPIPPPPEAAESEDEAEDDAMDDEEEEDLSESEVTQRLEALNEARLQEKLGHLQKSKFLSLYDVRRTVLPYLQRQWMELRTSQLGSSKRAKLSDRAHRELTSRSQLKRSKKKTSAAPTYRNPLPTLLSEKALEQLMLGSADGRPTLESVLGEMIQARTRVRLLSPRILRWNLGPAIGEEDDDDDDNEEDGEGKGAEEEEEGDVLRVLHAQGNSRVGGEAPLQCLQFPVSDRHGLKQLIRAHPGTLRVNELRVGEPKTTVGSSGAPIPDTQAQLEFVRELFMDGLVQLQQF